MSAKLKVPPRPELFRVIDPMIDQGLSAAEIVRRTGWDISRSRMGSYIRERQATKGQPWELNPRDRDSELARIAENLESPGQQPWEVLHVRAILDEHDAVLTYTYDRGFEAAPRRKGEKYLRR